MKRQESGEASKADAAPTSATRAAEAERRLSGLMSDLAELQAYLRERGDHTYELAQRFMANARRDASSRAYDERQATMLEYQHYVWHEIAGRVGQILARYEDGEDIEGEDAAEQK